MLQLYTGLFVGSVGGVAIGLAISWSRWLRRLIDLPMQLLRTLPLLAMVPLFQLWFGTNFSGKVTFIGYGVGVLFVAGTIKAVKNVPQIYVDNARTLGASKLVLYKTVIIPAMFPELRSSIMLSLGTAWATVIGAEYLGPKQDLDISSYTLSSLATSIGCFSWRCCSLLTLRSATLCSTPSRLGFPYGLRNRLL